METCDGCNRTAEDMKLSCLCEECVDKAAKYDITEWHRKKLAEGMQAVIEELGREDDEDKVSVAIGKINLYLKIKNIL